MSGTIDAFEVVIEETFVKLESIVLAFNSAKCALIVAATTPSLASIRDYTLIGVLSSLCFDRLNSEQELYNIKQDVLNDATLASMAVRIAALSSVRQLDIGPIAQSEMNVVLRRVASKATVTAVQTICSRMLFYAAQPPASPTHLTLIFRPELTPESLSTIPLASAHRGRPRWLMMNSGSQRSSKWAHRLISKY